MSRIKELELLLEYFDGVAKAGGEIGINQKIPVFDEKGGKYDPKIQKASVFAHIANFYCSKVVVGANGAKCRYSKDGIYDFSKAMGFDSVEELDEWMKTDVAWAWDGKGHFYKKDQFKMQGYKANDPMGVVVKLKIVTGVLKGLSERQIVDSVLRYEGEFRAGEWLDKKEAKIYNGLIRSVRSSKGYKEVVGDVGRRQWVFGISNKIANMVKYPALVEKSRANCTFSNSRLVELSEVKALAVELGLDKLLEKLKLLDETGLYNNPLNNKVDYKSYVNQAPSCRMILEAKKNCRFVTKQKGCNKSGIGIGD